MADRLFILIPGALNKPVGGHKVVYQYANMLVSNGYEVTIVNNIFSPSNENAFVEFLRKVHLSIRYIANRLTNRTTCRGWFPLSDRIKEIAVWTFDKLGLGQDDYCIATDATTAPYLDRYSIPFSHKLYFIQHYENWRMTDKQLRATYHFNMKKVVISKWLGSVLDGEGVSYSIVPNGFDTKEFYLTIPIEKKDKYLVSMLYHKSDWKNVKLGFDALNVVKRKIPQLRVTLFGVYDSPEEIPEWYEYIKSPSVTDHNLLNNKAAIYVGTSLKEGWGLTVGEAMMCGQAVCCTDAEGYLEMASNMETALVSDKHSVDALASNIIALIENDELRIRIANNGWRSIKQFDIQQSCRKFLEVLRQ